MTIPVPVDDGQRRPPERPMPSGVLALVGLLLLSGAWLVFRAPSSSSHGRGPVARSDRQFQLHLTAPASALASGGSFYVLGNAGNSLHVSGYLTGGRDPIRVTVQGAPVALSRDLKLAPISATAEFSVSVPLTPGRNRIVLTARDGAGDSTLTTLYAVGEHAAHDATGQRFAMLIGVSTYRDPQIAPLPCTQHDVAALRAVLVDPRAGGLRIDG